MPNVTQGKNWKLEEAVMRWLFAPITWLGRVCLWIVFWPLGLWRSIRHGSKKRERRIVDEIRKQQRPQG